MMMMQQRQNSLLHHPDQARITPEFENVIAFLKNHKDIGSWPSHVPFASTDVQRLSADAATEIIAALSQGQGEGHPGIVTNATTGWKTAELWVMEYFRQSGGDVQVRVNDRAPARRADHGSGGQQRSVQLPLREYIDYVEQSPKSLNQLELEKCSSTPFYLNGWRAFHDIPSLVDDCPSRPSFAAPIDDTLAILAEIDAQLFKAAPSVPASTAWCRQVDENLRKVFISPPGCVTRLHFDAGDAHGWLAQVSGRKLFILLPPTDTKYLYPLTSEVETVQSPICPLCPDLQQWSSYQNAHPLACILHPGEAIIIPRGWWHYAVSLDTSITVQRNFYHAPTNASGLVQMVLKTAANIKKTSG